jgi:uncharacterized protein YgiM (DUF1202 family)
MARNGRTVTPPQDLIVVARRVGPWVLLFVLLIWVYSLYGQYQAGKAAFDAQNRSSRIATTTVGVKKPAPSKTSTATAGKGGTAGINAITKVQVVSDVNLHDQPSGSATVIRVLKTGEKLTLVGQSGAWYKVTDTAGVIGWVSDSTRYTKLVPAK